MRRLTAIIALSALLFGLFGASVANAEDPFPVTQVKDGFTDPVYVTNAGDERLFVVEQGGLVKIIHPDLSVTTFLDASSIILHDAERGLFSIAFHPDYDVNGLFYVMYTRAGDGATALAEYHVSADDPDVADPASFREVIAVPHPSTCHNGGWAGFHGRYLYMTVGDGCSSYDNLGLAQSKQSLNGKILRIDPRDPDGAGPRTYSVAPGNPFVRRKGLDAIWALGLRNTWRCSFDALTGKLWCGDVGQDFYEEIDRVSTRHGGYNFGWNKIEGFHNYTAGGNTAPLCTSDCKTLPIGEYTHAVNYPSCSSITGGYVSRRQGAAMYGKYVFGDFCSGRVWIISSKRGHVPSLPPPVADTSFSIASFGESADGHIFLVDRTGGAIYLLDNS